MAQYDMEDGFTCECCGKTIGGGLYDFQESVALMRENNWISRCVKGEWLNFCSQECLEKYRAIK